MRQSIILCMVLALAGSGCDTVDKLRMRLVGIRVCSPEEESAEWVLAEALRAANDPDEERGWRDFQRLLHSSERTPAALRGWREGGWTRMRHQAKQYLDNGQCFELVDFREMQGSVGYDYFVASSTRELPTPCSVYLDADNHNLWRIKRCSL